MKVRLVNHRTGEAREVSPEDILRKQAELEETQFRMTHDASGPRPMSDPTDVEQAMMARLLQDCEHFIGMEDHKSDIRALLDSHGRLRADFDALKETDAEILRDSERKTREITALKDSHERLRLEVERLTQRVEWFEKGGGESAHKPAREKEGR